MPLCNRAGYQISGEPPDDPRSAVVQITVIRVVRGALALACVLGEDQRAMGDGTWTDPNSSVHALRGHSGKGVPWIHRGIANLTI